MMMMMKKKKMLILVLVTMTRTLMNDEDACEDDATMTSPMQRTWSARFISSLTIPLLLATRTAWL
jgi:hypothetical protein